MQKKDVMKKIADQVIKAMDNHGKNWLCPWSKQGMPKNIRGSYYTGINTFILWCIQSENKYKSQTYATFNQIKQNGGKVNKGQKAHQVVFWTPLTIQVKDKQGEDTDKTFPYMKFYNVFNLDQTTLNDKDIIVSDGADTLPNVEQYIKNTKADIRYDNQLYAGKCYYVPSLDYIGMVTKDKFNNLDGSNATENYYATILHELTHWTGHSDRCNRQEKYKAKYFDDMDKYAFEELVAETGSAILCSLLNVSSSPRVDHAKYLNHWIDLLEDKPRSIMTAFSQSSKAIDYLDKLQNKAKKVA